MLVVGRRTWAKVQNQFSFAWCVAFLIYSPAVCRALVVKVTESLQAIVVTVKAEPVVTAVEG